MTVEEQAIHLGCAAAGHNINGVIKSTMQFHPGGVGAHVLIWSISAKLQHCCVQNNDDWGDWEMASEQVGCSGQAWRETWPGKCPRQMLLIMLFLFQTPDSKSYPNKHILLAAVTMDKWACASVSLCDMRHSGTLKTKG